MTSGIFQGYLLVTDMDGTLLTSEKKISEQNRQAIARFVEGGGLFTLATGRIAQSAGLFVDQLPINAPAILYNGAMIYDYQRAEVIWERTLPAKIDRLLDRVLKHFPEVGVELYSGGKPYFVRENRITLQHREIERFYGQSVSEYNEVPGPWYKVLLAGEPSYMDTVEAEVAAWDTDEALWVRSDAKYLEMIPLEATKGHALEELLSLVGIEQQKSIAVGDNLNDWELLRRAGVGIAVANAHEKLLDAVEMQGRHHNDHAIAGVIEWLEAKLRQ